MRLRYFRCRPVRLILGIMYLALLLLIGGFVLSVTREIGAHVDLKTIERTTELNVENLDIRKPRDITAEQLLRQTQVSSKIKQIDVVNVVEKTQIDMERHISVTEFHTNIDAVNPINTTTTSTTTTTTTPELGLNAFDDAIKLSYPIIRNNVFIAPRQIVHFDLKGAPPTVNYFKQIFPLISSLGATGVLIEWEDMFPFTGNLSAACNGQAYSEDQVDTILQSAKEAHLEIIPLVQTFGHLEWILKLPQFAHLREDHRYTMIACVGMEEAWTLIQDAINQVAKKHRSFGLPFFHIGADEVFTVGNCMEDALLIRQHRNKERFILWHIARTARFVREVHRTRVLAWHDMFTNSKPDDIKEYGLTRLIEPVIWSYAEQLDRYLQPATWVKLQVFPHIWGASAFKGADGPGRFYANPNHYLENNKGWLKQMTQFYREYRQLRGLILTGWSRYDHLAALCEVFPVGLPSLALSLFALNLEANETANFQLLGCTLRPTTAVARGCTFPGARVYEEIQRLSETLVRLSEFYSEHEIGGWMSATALKLSVSNSWYVNKLLNRIEGFVTILEQLAKNVAAGLNAIFYSDVAVEFNFLYIKPHLDKLREYQAAAHRIMKQTAFSKRPFIQFLPKITSTVKTEVKTEPSGNR